MSVVSTLVFRPCPQNQRENFIAKSGEGPRCLVCKKSSWVKRHDSRLYLWLTSSADFCAHNRCLIVWKKLKVQFIRNHQLDNNIEGHMSRVLRTKVKYKECLQIFYEDDQEVLETVQKVARINQFKLSTLLKGRSFENKQKLRDHFMHHAKEFLGGQRAYQALNELTRSDEPPRKKRKVEKPSESMEEDPLESDYYVLDEKFFREKEDEANNKKLESHDSLFAKYETFWC